MHIPRRIRAGLLGVALALGLVAAPGTAHAAPDLDSYRVLTYNTQLRPWVAFDETTYGIENTTRARAIANRILAGESDGTYDIVVLNEVFDEDARDVLVAKLSPTFPFFVSKLEHPGPDVEEDSGLMLFSRFPIVSMNNTGNDCYRFDVNLKCLVAFHVFNASSGVDALAAKGMGMVRISNPRSDKLEQVYFTHLQADDDAAARAARAAQVAEAVTFIKSWSGTSGLDDVVLAGDLNIKGGTTEFANLVLSANGFAGAGLFDTWFRHMPSTDPGRTFDSDLNSAAGADGSTGGNRLDYILFRHSTEVRSCVQHLTLERHSTGEFFKPDPEPDGTHIITDLSDHFPLAANIGKPQAQCSPVSPLVPSESAMLNPADGWHAQNMLRTGGFQWFRYNTPGTYTFKVLQPQQQNMIVEVFDATDLSTPVVPFSGSNVLSTPPCGVACLPSPPVVVDTTGPFFVRVRMQNPLFTGSYNFYSHLHQGASFDDAIVLAPFETLFQVQMSNQVANPMTTVHYALKQRALTSGASQKLTFNTGGHAGSSYQIKVFDANKVQFAGMASNYKSGTQTLATPVPSPISGAAQNMFFTVNRLGCGGPCPLSTYSVGWTTDYRNLDLKRFWIKDQNDDPEPTDNDEVLCNVMIDSLSTVPVPFGTIDEGGARYFPAPLRDIGFTTKVNVQCFELDDFFDDHTIIQGVTAAQIDATDPLTGTLKYMVFIDNSNDVDDTDGLYRIDFTGRRKMQP